MKKFLAPVIIAALLISLAPAAFAKTEVLRVYNWQDYIDDGKDEDGAQVDKSVMQLWEEDYFARTGKKVRVQYDTFETNETMLNTLRTGKTTYDLVCPSDYVIQKMIAATRSGTDENISIEEFDLSKMENYRKYVSPYISNIFESYGWTKYAVGYMWGTVGFLYNPEKVKQKDVSTWALPWNTNYRNRISCKDVSRDAYVMGSLYVYRDKLSAKVKEWEDGKLTDDELQKTVNDIANLTDDETIDKVEQALSLMKENIYGFEVDSGKSDIVSGKIDANLAWSGDAVYAMDLADEEDDKRLQFVIPNEGSTIWFDGWLMPKGANTELAQDFVDFLCRPEIAAKNMGYIGYCSVVAGDDIFAFVKDTYGDEKGKIDYDLTYFFGGTVSDKYIGKNGKISIKTDSPYRQLATLYPSSKQTARLGVMEDFGDRNEKVLEMWSKVKSNSVSALSYVTMGLVIFLIAAAAVFNQHKKNIRRRRIKRLREKND